MIRDRVATRNERVKLISSSLNTIGLGLIGIGIVRPLVDGELVALTVEDAQIVPWDDEKIKIIKEFPALSDNKLGEFFAQEAPSIVSYVPAWTLWFLVGLALHAIAHYIVGYIRKEKT